MAADFSAVAIEKGRALEAAHGTGSIPIDWRVSDAVSQPILGGGFNLVVIAYLQLPMPSRRGAHQGAADALTVGGTLLVVAHDSSNIAEGAGGPQDPSVLFTADDVLTDLAETVPLRVDEAGVVLRPVADAPRPARDMLVRVTLNRAMFCGVALSGAVLAELRFTAAATDAWAPGLRCRVRFRFGLAVVGCAAWLAFRLMR